jgi:hypothetical protein
MQVVEWDHFTAFNTFKVIYKSGRACTVSKEEAVMLLVRPNRQVVEIMNLHTCITLIRQECDDEEARRRVEASFRITI